MTARQTVAVVMLAAVVLVTSACGGTAPTPHVATLDTDGATPGPTPTPTAGDAGRPRERIDMTKDELTALQAPYLSCLKEHGLDMKDRDSQAFIAQDKQEANEACERFDPLPPWEVDANNPQAADFVVKVVDCLRAKGVKYVEVGSGDEGIVGPSFGGPQNDAQSITRGLQLTPECEKEVAAKK